VDAAAAGGVRRERGRRCPYLVGTMIELPRAALLADKIAEHADFLSFGTNDLTQTTLGMSRDDAGRFLPDYVRAGILPRDPFVSIDVEGWGSWSRWATALGRSAGRDLKVGVCGEHGGDPGQRRVLRAGGAGLRQLLAVPGADRPPRRRPRQLGAPRGRGEGREPRLAGGARRCCPPPQRRSAEKPAARRSARGQAPAQGRRYSRWAG
jgi:hypothetical protein